MKLSKDLDQIFIHNPNETVTFQTILDRVSTKSFGILLVILALPSALPIPAPGYSVPFGLALLGLGIQMILTREYPWFPERVRRRRVHTRHDSRLVRGMVKFLSFFEKFVRPRFRFVFTNHVFYRGLGVIVTACAASMCLPIPFTNSGPALGIFLIGLGTLEEDGLAAMAGIFVAACGILLTTTILVLMIFFGMEAADMVKDFVKGLLGMSA